MKNRFRRAGAVLGICSMIATGIVAFPNSGYAGMLFDAGVRARYEDNITRSPVDVAEDGDFYTNAFVSAGTYREIREATTFLMLRAGVDVYSYNTYDELNEVSGFASIGLYRRYSEIFSGFAKVRGRGSDFEDRERDSIAAGFTIELRQQVTSRLWIKQSYEYERNEARSELFTYDAHGVSVWGGLTVTPKTVLGAGYGYLLYRYDDETHFESRSHTVSVEVERFLTSAIYVSVSYDWQYYSVGPPEAKYHNHIYSAGLAYSY